MFDAIVIGARCAGASTAMLLGRRGYRVLLVDRASFPSNTISGHDMQQAAVAHLKRWGLLPALVASGCPPVRCVTMDFGDFAFTGSPPPVDGVAEGYCARRMVLDKILVDAAATAGVEVREGFGIDDLVWEGDTVTGIRGRQSNGGATVIEKARIVVGADGMRSQTARRVQAPCYRSVPALTCAYLAYWSGIPLKGTELYPRAGRFIAACPTHDGLTMINILWPLEMFDQVRGNIEKNFHQSLDELTPSLAERVRKGRREERFIGMPAAPSFMRRPFGPGWALVGDAGYHKDAITAQGIADSFRGAQMLADAIDAGFAGRQPLSEALADYERQRNEAAGPMYEFTCQRATLTPPPPEMQQLFRALRGNQKEINRFFGILAGSVPISEFFAPENVQRIVKEASLRLTPSPTEMFSQAAVTISC